MLNITGKVIPVTLDEITICAELNDGTVIEQKDRIPEVVTQKVESINRIFISPSNCQPAPGVLEAIESAEAIILGPGSLYTNVIPNLLVKNVSKAIKESKAIKLYVSNIMTEEGQTDNYTLADHVKAIQAHAGKGVFDLVLADTEEVMPEFVRIYNRAGSEIVEANISDTTNLGVKVIERNMSCVKNDKIRHNPDIIASTIMDLICNELKFEDKQNETEYLLINSVLKEQKKLQKKRAKEALRRKGNVKKEVPQVKKGKKSKFATKYKDRVQSIQTSNEITAENRRVADEENRRQQEELERQQNNNNQEKRQDKKQKKKKKR